MIQMVDLKKQYLRIQAEIDTAVLDCIRSTAFINGPPVNEFAIELARYLDVKHVIPCANGTDALQIAMMALGLKPGDEVILPAHTYFATAEVIGLLKLTPVMVDVDEDTFLVNVDQIKAAITPRTKAIVPVHLYGQSADMEEIMKIADAHGIYVIEDNAQAIGANYTFSSGRTQKTGTIGHVGCTSFFPSKNLGCYGDGGAMCTNDDELAQKLRMIANHGQSRRYYHDEIGINSRLDSIQAAILKVKLKYLDSYNSCRAYAARFYDQAFADVKELQTPVVQNNSTHVYHQYTLRVLYGNRNDFQNHLTNLGVPTMIYYPVPLYNQLAFKGMIPEGFSLPVTDLLSEQVISLPIHTEMDDVLLNQIASAVRMYFNN
jgi:UDP-2-acetamido-2-deoxy-ribo-hexuluronate aminotransferase